MIVYQGLHYVVRGINLRIIATVHGSHAKYGMRGAKGRGLITMEINKFLLLVGLK